MLHQTQFMGNVIVLPLVCCDLIYGIQWLKFLGLILWDFEKLQMEFTTRCRKLFSEVPKGRIVLFLYHCQPRRPFIPTYHLLKHMGLILIYTLILPLQLIPMETLFRNLLFTSS